MPNMSWYADAVLHDLPEDRPPAVQLHLRGIPPDHESARHGDAGGAAEGDVYHADRERGRVRGGHGNRAG